jgi:glycosyltransferase involved in cell wall biosynthesis
MSVLRTKKDCKRFLGLNPERTVMLRTDRNMPRKNYASLLRAVAPILAKHPETDLLLHCLPLDQGGDLADEISKYGPLGERMLLSNFAGRADRKVMRALYNAADVYVSVSAEGFGLTIAEAIACGIPAVAMDYSSVPEVLGPAGTLVPMAGLIDNIYSHFWAIVNEPKFGEALEPLVTDHFLRKRLGSQGPPHVREHFTWKHAAEQFSDLVTAAVPEYVEVAV